MQRFLFAIVQLAFVGLIGSAPLLIKSCNKSISHIAPHTTLELAPKVIVDAHPQALMSTIKESPESFLKSTPHSLNNVEAASKTVDQIFVTGAIKNEDDLRLTPNQTFHYYKAVRARNSVYAVIPSDEEGFRAVFSANPTVSDSHQIAAEEKLFSHIGNVHVPENESGFEDFVHYLHSEPSDFVTIVGHNEDGSFKFLNGSGIPIKKMADACRAMLKRCIFLSCNSNDHLQGSDMIGIKSKITFGEGALIAGEINKYIVNGRRNKQISMSSVARKLPEFLDSLEKSARISRHMTATIIPITGVASVPMILVAVDQKDS